MARTRRDWQRWAQRGTTTQRGYGRLDHMARYAGTTTQRGLGAGHQKVGVQLFRAWKPGDPCARCGQPMWDRWIYGANGKRVSAIDVDDFPGRRYGGPQVKRLSHRSCNRRAGQQVTAAINRARGGLTPRQMTAIRMKQWQAARQW